jgi:putative endonuclease
MNRGPLAVSRKELGERGERLAEKFLKKNGYRIAARNYRCPLGEIDLIARDGDTIVFVEIKGKSSRRFGSAAGAVTAAKQRRLARVASHYLSTFKLHDSYVRFDVVGIHWVGTGRPEIELVKDAFRLSR